jgi:hypothetical protein
MEQQRLSDERMSALDGSLVETDIRGEDADQSLLGSPQDGKYVYCIIRHENQRDFGDIGI